MMQLQHRLSFLGQSSVEQKTGNTTIKFRFTSEIQPVHPMRLKIEINCREHFAILDWQKTDFMLESSWFSGSCQLTTFKLEELLGTKVRALYQRRKGRDLYDLYKALIANKVDISELSHCYHKYMNFSVHKPPTKKEFLLNLDNKMKDKDFIGDTVALIRPEEEYNIFVAYSRVREELLELLF